MPNRLLLDCPSNVRGARLLFFEFYLASEVATLDPQAVGFVTSVTNNGTGLYDVVLAHEYQKLLGCDITLVKATAADSKWQVMGELATVGSVSTFTLGNIDLETPALSAPGDMTVKVCLAVASNRI